MFIASAEAAVKLRRRHRIWPIGLDSIWAGEPIVKDIVIARSDSSDMTWADDLATLQQAPDEQTEQLEGNDSVIKRFKRDGDLAAARRQLEQVVQKEPKNAAAWFNSAAWP